jgi:hypothetical protein
MRDKRVLNVSYVRDALQSCTCRFLSGLFLHPEEQGTMFLRIIRQFSTDYKALYKRRQHFIINTVNIKFYNNVVRLVTSRSIVILRYNPPQNGKTISGDSLLLSVQCSSSLQLLHSYDMDHNILEQDILKSATYEAPCYVIFTTFPSLRSKQFPFEL